MAVAIDLEKWNEIVRAHGAICVLKERLFVQSDPYRVHVREHCGLMAIADLNNRKFLCKGCQERANIVQILFFNLF